MSVTEEEARLANALHASKARTKLLARICKIWDCPSCGDELMFHPIEMVTICGCGENRALTNAQEVYLTPDSHYA